MHECGYEYGRLWVCVGMYMSVGMCVGICERVDVGMC